MKTYVNVHSASW